MSRESAGKFKAISEKFLDTLLDNSRRSAENFAGPLLEKFLEILEIPEISKKS